MIGCPNPYTIAYYLLAPAFVAGIIVGIRLRRGKR